VLYKHALEHGKYVLVLDDKQAFVCKCVVAHDERYGGVPHDVSANGEVGDDIAHLVDNGRSSLSIES